MEISDGSTIPGLGDRVMAWDDRDEDFSREEEWIEAQPRYNPTYDLKGFYYRWIEPRFKPQLWDDMTQDLAGVHPAKRFAKVQSDNESDDASQILRILEVIKDRILADKMKATRIVVTSDIYKLVKKILDIDGVNIKPFRLSRTADGEFIYAVWITAPTVNVETLREAETRFQNSDTPSDLDDLIEDLMGMSYHRSQAVTEIVNEAKSMAESVDVMDLYIIGMYAREKALDIDDPDVEQLDFSTSSPMQNAQLGQLLAKRLGVESFVDKNDITFSYKGIKMEFSLGASKNELAYLSKLKKYQRTQIVIDIMRRDFTINMFAYNVVTGGIIDPLKVARKALRDGILKTYFQPKTIVKRNPIVILRAIKLTLQYGLDIDKDLTYAMISYSPLLFKGMFSNFDLLFARESVRSEGRKEADKLFDEYGLWKLKKIK